ncbi:MAG: FAD binding domain-containing protein [Alphaproteobacteria bacterium]|jgi:carbon-monoxide dehydrogenase medium subunit|nr:FAD binding domain-containing protein [Alphaproteobacteria bacterium]MDP6517286.1 FAD binding domain-containing protein [Alphaproteobacteria bacterium]|tara:strand:+ start:42 stop:836 length:795 start_codon:yes stop_codon:yes gene_type:complete
MYDFTYHRAGSLDAAKAAFQAADDGAYMAGGMTLLPTLKQRLARPSDVIDLAGVGDLTGVARDGDALVIKAMTTHAAVAASDVVTGAIPALAALAGRIGDPHVRNRGTIAGAIANADPAADHPAAVLGLNASVVTDRREIGSDDFFTGLFETALEVGELITAVRFPIPDAACYMKFANPASRYAIVGVMVARTGSGVRVAVTGAGPNVSRVAAMEQALTDDFSAAALDGIGIDSADLNADIHAGADYRAHLIGVMARRAVAGCG